MLPSAPLSRICWVAVVRLGMPSCVVWPSAYYPFSLCVGERREASQSCCLPLADIIHLLWHDRYGRIQAPIGEAAGDLRNLPGPTLHTEYEPKRALIVVRIPVGSNGLEQQEPGRR